MAKFQNKYRIESARLQGWDYRSAGAYFITICTHHRVHHFGECKDGRMKLSTMGLIVQGCWYEIPRLNHQVRLGEFIVMPNHVHGILMLEEMDDGHEIGDGVVETLQCNVSTDENTDANMNINTNADVNADANTDTHPKSEFFRGISPKRGSVSRMLGSFKSACSYHIHKAFPDAEFAWQERFHDHIIRSEESFVQISNYIVNNPLKWEEDMFFQEE
ncbi:MAG: transposase [Saprospiraceae bacterium]|nr:transposase [Saprospiraceae bacterium]